MASLTPARIAGVSDERGSIAPGKFADLVILDKDLQVQDVYVEGNKIERPARASE